MKKSALVIAAGILFAAQSTQGQWATHPAMPFPPPAQTARPIVLPAVAQLVLTAQAEPVAAKELWLGDVSLYFHVQARESLQVVHGASLLKKIARSQAWENLKPVFLRAALVAILQENRTAPLSSPMRAVRLIQKSA